METTEPSQLHYKRSNFVTSLPVGRRYSPSHCWLEERDGVWRVGFTRFATRMLGDPVDHRFDTAPGTDVRAGDVLGWIEGFKAISDVFCVVTGEFRGGNPGLAEDLELIRRDGYGAGWLYEVRGDPDALTLDVHGYRDLLDRTIDRLRTAHPGTSQPLSQCSWIRWAVSAAVSAAPTSIQTTWAR